MRARCALLVSLSLLSAPATAGALQIAPPGTAPPGAAGVNQYLEDVPAATGNRPSISFAPHGANPPAAPAVQRSLLRLGGLGAEGAGAAGLAAAGVPPATKVRGGAAIARAAGGVSGGGMAAAVAHVVEGSGGGMGAALPLILATALLGTALGFALHRRRA